MVSLKKINGFNNSNRRDVSSDSSDKRDAGKFKIQEGDKEIEEKEGMSFKKTLKSLVTSNPKWTGWIAYKNKKDRYVKHSILKGKRI